MENETTNTSGNGNGNTDLFNAGNNIAVDTVVKKRGRPTKEETTRKARENANVLQTLQQQNGQAPNSNALSDLLKEYKEVDASEIKILPSANNAPIDAPKEMVKNYFTGALVLVLVDALLPNLMLFLLRQYKPKVKVKIDDLQMTSEEQKSLEPLMDAVIQSYVGTMPPEQALIMSLIMIYGSKAIPYLND